MATHNSEKQLYPSADVPLYSPEQYRRTAPPLPPRSGYPQNAHDSAGAGIARSFETFDLKRVEELQQREQGLNAREQDLLRREKELQQRLRSKQAREPNWPIYLHLVHQDVKSDVAGSYAQSVVYIAFFTWFAIAPVLLFNIACLIATNIVMGGSRYLPDLVLSFIYLFVFPPLTFGFYRTLYNAARKSKKQLYITFMILMGLSSALLVFFIFGVRGSGAAGIVTAVRTFDEGEDVVGALCIVMAVLWGIMAFTQFMLGVLCLRFFRQKARLHSQTMSSATTASGDV